MSTKENAQDRGIPLSPTKPTQQRRATWHNYSKPGWYMLTLEVLDRSPLLGKLQSKPEPSILFSDLGYEIYKTEQNKITQFYPNVKVHKICIMPDHIHILVHVSAPFPEKRNLGYVVRGFKSGCNNAMWRIHGKSNIGLFKEGYNDRIILSGMEIEGWSKYMADNPRRLAMKRANPHLFTTLYDFDINGKPCQITGNRFLLDIPDKMAVIVHRADNDATYRRKCEEWLACGERGGVLVSASIALREKVVLREAFERGYSIILLRENGFPKLYKPVGRAFDACAAGHLLEISPWQYHNEQRTITRAQCLELNALALAITGGR